MQEKKSFLEGRFLYTLCAPESQTVIHTYCTVSIVFDQMNVIPPASYLYITIKI